MRQKLETLADGMIYVENRNRLLDDVGIQQVIYPCPCDMPGNSQDYNRVDWNCLANINDIFGKYSKIVYNDSINCRVELKICDYYGNEILNSCNDIRGSLTKPMDLNGEFWWRTISKIFANLDSTDLKEVSVGVRLTNNYTNEVARRIINYNFPEPNKVPNYRGQIAAGPPNEAYLPPFVVDGFKIKKDSSINIWFPVTGLFPDQSDSSLFKGNVRISLYNIETHDRIPHARIVTETLKFGKIGDTLGTIDFSFYPLEDSLKIERDGEITEYSAKYNITSDGRNGYFIINIPTNVKKGLYNILIDVMSPDSTDLEKTVTTADIPYVNIE